MMLADLARANNYITPVNVLLRAFNPFIVELLSYGNNEIK